MNIKQITEPQLQECVQLYQQTFSGEPWNEPWTEERAFERLNHFYQSRGFIGLGAWNEEGCCAFTLGNREPFLDRQAFYLREMCVKPDFQRQGIGRRLLVALHGLLKESGLARIYLLTNHDYAAYDFYKKIGYKPADGMEMLIYRL